MNETATAVVNWAALAAKLWPNAQFIAGVGRYAVISYCCPPGLKLGPRVALCTNADEQFDLLVRVDTEGCGQGCVRNHREFIINKNSGKKSS